MGYIIGSFNTHDFGRGDHDKGLMADIIISERFDIVALQEVARPEALESLKNELDGWDACYGNSDRKYQSFHKGFGYLWNTNRIKACNPPTIFSRYNRNICQMSRDPYSGRFTPSGTPGGAFFEIRLINVHLKANYNDPQIIPRTKDEHKLVTTEIHRIISNQRYGDNMPAYTFILGDHNLLCVDCNTINQLTGKGIVTKQEEKTWISYPNPQVNNPQVNFESDLDHFSYHEARFNGTTVIITRVDAVSKYCQNDFKEYRKKVSDHVPIKLELILN